MQRSNLRWLAGIFITSALAVLTVGWWSRFKAPFRVQVKQVAIQLPRRHEALGGLSIAFVTDTHVGPHFRATDLEPVFAHLERLGPDLVIFGGDFICESPRFLHEIGPAVERMARTGKLGAWGILGNHDLANIRERVVPVIEAAGVKMLVNQSVRIETPNGDLWLAGIDDALIGEPDLPATFGDIPADAATICLWHEPDLAADVEPFGPFLMLSGHTHGGQVRVPSVGPLATPEMGQEYVLGRYQIGDMELYVSGGLGIYRPPVRFNCPPELTIIRLLA